MKIPFYQVDAFTSRRFAGNPAAVMLFESYPSDAVLQALAAENNQAETAFLVPEGPDYRIRWFTPTVEVPLCGHATLASAAVLLERVHPGRQAIVFHSRSGPLPVQRLVAGYRMEFPARPSQPFAETVAWEAILGAAPVEVWAHAVDHIVLLPAAATVRNLAPDLAAVARLDRHGLIATAPGGDEGYDFVSRYFAPAKGIPEDPVTGGAHCSLAPFWAPRLGKTEFHAFQASARGGEIRCRLVGDRVLLEGACAFYLEGSAEV